MGFRGSRVEIEDRDERGWPEDQQLHLADGVGMGRGQFRLRDEARRPSAANPATRGFCGDFNSDNDDVPVRAICGPVEETGNPDHGPRVLVPCEYNVPEPSRYSLLHLGRGEMLDHILASRPLLGFFRHAEIHNEVLPDESGAFRTDVKFPESDHAPVVAEFHIP
jgi:hypothetical protein